jgi:hypothetical protein
MSQFWGLSISDDSFVDCALAPHLDSLNLITGDTGWWGLGYYSRGELLQRFEPKKTGEPLDVAEVTHGLKADLIFMHTRNATVGQMRRENVHPFRFKEWLFAHNGTIYGFEEIKPKILDSIPSFIHRNLKGETDSEHLFHLFLSFLYDAGMLNRPDPGIMPIGDALVRTFATVDEFAGVAGEEASASSFIVSDGYSLVAGGRHIPVDYTVIDGIEDCPVCRKSIRPGDSAAAPVGHDALKAVIVRSAGGDAPPPVFSRLRDNTLLMVSRAQEVTLRPFD